MKAFVYNKKSNKKIATIVNVISVNTYQPGKITLITITGEEFNFDTKTMKTTIYQN